MRKIVFLWGMILAFAAACAAQSGVLPAKANIRFSAQISNGPAGSCGCFAMQGGAGDLAWSIHKFGLDENAKLISGVADISVEHTGSVNGAPYGLTLTTLAFGPRFRFPASKAGIFVQSLFGFTHGSDSQFPVHNTLQPSANSFALDLGGGVDYPVNSRRFSWRVIQVDYLRTALPNNSTDWQNNLRMSTGVNFLFH